jgi:DNA mismatch endonuclease (patch repair protein)
MDTLSQRERSERMARVKSKDTKPEIAVRKLVYSLGYRYRLHGKCLPGTPDLVFNGRGKIIFVHGCFWHRHRGCSRCRLPKSRLEFWGPKLEENRTRDIRNQRKLRKAGWRSLTIWECELGDREILARKVVRFLDEAAGRSG